MAHVGLLIARERLPDAVHLAANACQLRQHRVDQGTIFIELRQSGVGDAIELLAALGFDRGVADFFEVGEGRINHAGARSVKALRRFLESLDDLVPMPRMLLQQSEDHQLQIAGAQLAAAEEAASSKTAAMGERRPESAKVASVRAPRAAVMTKKAVHFDLLKVR